MWLGLILLVQLLHREVLVPVVEAKSPPRDGQPAKSEWPLEECRDTEPQSGGKQQAGCVCKREFQVCQPLQLSAPANGSITLPCRFSHSSSWEPSSEAQVHWRLGGFHAKRFLFNGCRGPAHTDARFQGRVSLASEEAEGGQRYTAAVSITALRESDAQLYFCRVSVVTPHGKEEWQTLNGTNLTVTGHCRKRTQARRAAGRGQEEAEDQALRCGGARAPPGEKPVSPLLGEPGLVYATLQLPDAPDKKRGVARGGRAEEETTYAAVRP